MMRRMTGGRGKGWGDARKKVMQAASFLFRVQDLGLGSRVRV